MPRRTCLIRDTKDMTLEEMTHWLTEQAANTRRWCGLQTGDPALYGALIETTQPLTAAGMPGGGARRVVGHGFDGGGRESMTLPEVTQSVIFTTRRGPHADAARGGPGRAGGASHHAVHLPVDHLVAQGRGRFAVRRLARRCAHAGGPQGQLARGGTVSCAAPWHDIKQRCRDAGIVSQAMVIASPTLGAASWDQLVRSKLLRPGFTHRFRKAIA